jgi:uncharacterized protein (UPF0332 family)
VEERIEQELEDIVNLVLSKLISFNLNYGAANYRECVVNLYFAYEGLIKYLLAVKGFFPQSHEGTQILFARHFVKEGALPKKIYNYLTNLYMRRKDADYRGFISFSQEDIDEYYQWLIEEYQHIEIYLQDKDRAIVKKTIIEGGKKM